MEIPLFPLSSIVLPEGLLPLRIFEPRYVEMVKQCFRNDTGFGICLIREGHEVGTPAEPHLLGTEVKISDWDQGPDGLLQITAQGVQRFRIHNHSANEDMLLIGQVELLPLECPQAIQEQFHPLVQRLREFLFRMEKYIRYPEPKFDDAVWVCNRLIEILPLSPTDKMTLLQMQSNTERLNVLQQYMFNQSEPAKPDI